MARSLLTFGKPHPRRKESTQGDDVDALIDQVVAGRVKRGLSQTEVARRVGCSKRTIMYIETKQKTPRLYMFLLYAAAAGDFRLALEPFGDA